MRNFSEHPVKPISELEVFIGCILNNTGVQTRRQRERSIRLKDEFDRITALIMTQLRPHGNNIVPLTGYESEMDALELCLACIHIGDERSSFANQRHRRDGSGELGSFQIVAACALLAEAEMFEQGKKGGVIHDEGQEPVCIIGISVLRKFKLFLYFLTRIQNRKFFIE